MVISLNELYVDVVSCTNCLHIYGGDVYFVLFVASVVTSVLFLVSQVLMY